MGIKSKKCSLSGVDLTFGVKNNSKTWNASLDRIDSNKNYTEDNVQWVLKKINRMKSDLDQKEFIKLCGLIWEYSKWQLES
jgi:hypothetical protein